MRWRLMHAGHSKEEVPLPIVIILDIYLRYGQTKAFVLLF